MMMLWFVLAVAWLTVTVLMGMLGRSLGNKVRYASLRKSVDRDADEAMAILRKSDILRGHDGF